MIFLNSQAIPYIMSISKRLFFTLTLILINVSLIADVDLKGTPFVKNYHRADYKGGNQTWDIQQGSNGMMYFANNDGLLEFNGSFWNTYNLPNNSIVRAIENGPDGILYAGGYNELGYYKIGLEGGAEYVSLLSLLPVELRDFEDVWKIYNHPDGIFFQSFKQLMIYKDDTITVINAPSVFHFSYMAKNEFYVNDMKLGLMRFAMGNLYPLSGLDRLIGKEIWGMQAIDNKLLIATNSDGTYLYDGNSLSELITKSTSFLKENQIYNMEFISKNQLVFGTIQDGLLICNIDGKPVQHINKKNGLQNNTILCVRRDFQGNLWIGTDHGIDYVELNSPLSRISDKYNLSTGYSAIIVGGRGYFGTNQGLFAHVDNEDDYFGTEKMALIKGTKGQVWSLNEIEGTLFCGHNNGAFIINDTIATRISNIPGAWLFTPIPGYQNKIISGTYTGLVLYSRQDGSWKFEKQLAGFSESSRKMVFDNNGHLWMTHGYKGIYRITFNDLYDSIVKVDHFNKSNSNLPDLATGLFTINDKTLFTTDQGIFQYSEEKDDFEINNKFNKLFNADFLRSIKIDSTGNIWYFTNTDVGVMRLGEDGNYLNISLPFKRLKGMFVSSFEFVYPFDEEAVLFGTENGFVSYNPKFSKDYGYEFSSYILSMSTSNPDSVYINKPLLKNKVILDFETNSIEFVFSANDFESSDKVLYSTYLEGNDKGWSGWDHRSTRTYTNLYEGNYSFKIRAKNIYGTISNENAMSFRVRPPFVRSTIAYGIYTFLLILFIFLFILAMRRRYSRIKLRSEKKQQELFRKKEEKLQRERLESEKEVIRMRNDKLREGLKLKDKELANSTMQMLHKNEMLITLRGELKKLAGLIGDEGHQFDVIRLVRQINKEIDNEKQWKVFETHFENVHEEFLKRIRTKYTNLTPKELKLCAYLRMNISSKEISVLMNISTRGVEISRYRLRKKLGLSRETNLTDFILSY